MNNWERKGAKLLIKYPIDTTVKQTVQAEVPAMICNFLPYTSKKLIETTAAIQSSKVKSIGIIYCIPGAIDATIYPP